jgi:hypothetical protein
MSLSVKLAVRFLDRVGGLQTMKPWTIWEVCIRVESLKGEGKAYVSELVWNWDFTWVIYWCVVWAMSKRVKGVLGSQGMWGCTKGHWGWNKNTCLHKGICKFTICTHYFVGKQHTQILFYQISSSKIVQNDIPILPSISTNMKDLSSSCTYAQ